MKNKIIRPLIAGLVFGVIATYGAFAATPAGEIPVWRQLESYSQKDKSFTEARRPQLETIEKEMSELKARTANLTEKDRARLSELDSQHKEIAGAMAEHEFTLSNDVAQFATERSKEARSKLVELKGGAAPASMDGQQPGQAPPSSAGVPGSAQPMTPSPKEELSPAQLAKQTALQDFENKAKKERDALLEELKKLPLDPDEAAHEQLKEKLRKIAVEEEAKIRLMPPGPKRQRREEFEKKIQAERKALLAKFETAPASAPQPAKDQA